MAGAVLVAGIVGAVVHHSPHSQGVVTAGRTPPATRRSHLSFPTTTARPAPTTTRPGSAAVPGRSSATLEANLLTPTDLGGYYHVVPGDGSSLLASAPCLAGLSPSAAQSGRAVSALLGPDIMSLPEIVEIVVSYPGSASLRVFQALETTMQGCTTFSADIAGAEVHVPMHAGQLPSLAQGSALYQGEYRQDGRTLQLSIGLAADNGEVILIAYLDTQPPSQAIFGGISSTLSAAIGKES